MPEEIVGISNLKVNKFIKNSIPLVFIQPIKLFFCQLSQCDDKKRLKVSFYNLKYR